MKKIDRLDYSGIDVLPKHKSKNNLNTKLKYINNEKRKTTRLNKGIYFTSVKRNGTTFIKSNSKFRASRIWP